MMVGTGRPMEENNNFDSVKLAKVAGQESLEKVKFVDREKHNQMGKQDFLKLLTVQLQNQDPLNPMDQKKFAADLAQFSQLEQLANMNKTLEDQSSLNPIQSKFLASSFLGKTITTKGTSVVYDGQSSQVNLPFSLASEAKNVVIRVLDEKGQMVAQIDKENLSAGNHQILWNGDSTDGQKAGKGTYTFEVRAWDESMKQFMGETKSSGEVKAVSFEQGNPTFTLADGRTVFLRDVEQFTMDKLKAEQDKANQVQINADQLIPNQQVDSLIKPNAISNSKVRDMKQATEMYNQVNGQINNQQVNQL